MKNAETEAAWQYHDATKHSYQSVSSSRHFLDWGNQPLPFKIYKNLETIPLQEHLRSSGVPALDAIARLNRENRITLMDLQTLSEIFFLSAGITKKRAYPGGEMLFRAAACTGALYHIDLYFVCGDLPDLKAGVYHFNPKEFVLVKLRSGDFREVVVRASGRESSIESAPAILITASTYWRNAWKYQSRAYRHCFWDNGTILANLLAATEARDLPARVVVGFVDRIVENLLALDSRREGALALVSLGRTAEKAPASPALEPLTLETLPLSESEVDYPTIRSMQEASALESEHEVWTWRSARINEKTLSAISPERSFSLAPLSDDELPQDTLEEVILRRGSTRTFAPEAIAFSELSTMLYRSTRGIPADFLEPKEKSFNDIYLIVNAVDGLPPGAYFFNRDNLALELLKEGNFRKEAGYLGLTQQLPAEASVDVFFLADLKPILMRFGNRGYRAAELEASIMGGKLYLSAYALRLGASGLTFFDDDVTEFFSPHAAGKSVMFLIALGKSAKRKNP